MKKSMRERERNKNKNIKYVYSMRLALEEAKNEYEMRRNDQIKRVQDRV